MDEADVWQPVRVALAGWERMSLAPQFWLRDDDAVQPGAALERLLALTAGFEIPIAIAAIPSATGEELADSLIRHAHASPVIHGWAHRNHAGASEKKQEFGLHRPLEIMKFELQQALQRMRALYADRLVPMFVPPWNRMAPEVAAQLAGLGYTALSRFGDAPQVCESPAVAEVNTHVDIIDWHGTRGCGNRLLLAGSVAKCLSHSLADSRKPVGVLTHHLVHDEAAWIFLEQLFSVTRGCRWLTAQELIANATATASNS